MAYTAGYAGPPVGAPGAVDPMWPYFTQVAGADGVIDAEELQTCISRSGFCGEKQFSLETCRLMIGMLDDDHSGTMNFPEFQRLWQSLTQWKTTFLYYDRDQSGTINPSELQQAIVSFGYNVSQQAGNIIIKRYSKRGLGDITFDDFIALTIRLRHLSEQFRQRDTQGQGYATLSYDDFLKISLKV